MFTQDWSLQQHGNTAVQTPNGTDINDCDNHTWAVFWKPFLALQSQHRKGSQQPAPLQYLQQGARTGIPVNPSLSWKYYWNPLRNFFPNLVSFGLSFPFRLGKKCGSESNVTINPPSFIILNPYLTLYTLLFAHPHFCLCSGPTFQISAHRQNIFNTALSLLPMKVFTKAHKISGQRLRRAKPISSC